MSPKKNKNETFLVLCMTSTAKTFERNTINDFHARGNEITRKQFISTIIATCTTSQGTVNYLIL